MDSGSSLPTTRVLHQRIDIGYLGEPERSPSACNYTPFANISKFYVRNGACASSIKDDLQFTPMHTYCKYT